MFYRLRVTGCSSRVALSEMLRGFADSFARAALLPSRNVLRPGPDRPNVLICCYGCRFVVIFASVPAGFGPGLKVVVEERAAGPVSSDFYVFPCAAGGASGAGAGLPLLLPYCTRSNTPPPILLPTSGLSRRLWRRGARRYLKSASLHLSPPTSGLDRRGCRATSFHPVFFSSSFLRGQAQSAT